MIVEQFIEEIRIGIIAELFTVAKAIDYLKSNDWHTARDVPADKRDKMLEDLID